MPFRNFLVTNLALYGNCFTFNTNYNLERDNLAGRRESSLTGPSFGLNLNIALDRNNYVDQTKHVSYWWWWAILSIFKTLISAIFTGYIFEYPGRCTNSDSWYKGTATSSWVRNGHHSRYLHHDCNNWGKNL